MRGDDREDTRLFSYISPEDRVPADHPLRPIRKMVDRALEELSPLFDEMYSRVGPAVDCSGKAVASPSFAGLVLDP